MNTTIIIQPTLPSFPKEIIGSIFDYLIGEGKGTIFPVSRVGRTCKILYEISCRFLLERVVVQWQAEFKNTVVKNETGLIPSVLVHVSTKGSHEFEFPLTSLIPNKDEKDIDHLVRQALALWRPDSTSRWRCVNFINSILFLGLLKKKSDNESNYIDTLLKTVMIDQPYMKNLDSHCADHTMSMVQVLLKRNMITKNSSYLNQIIKAIKEESLYSRVCLFELMFKNGVLQESIDYFSEILTQGELLASTIINDSKEESELRRSVLRIYKISEFFQKIILTKFKLVVASAIIYELFIMIYCDDYDRNFKIIKATIDSEPSASDWFKPIIDSLAYARCFLDLESSVSATSNQKRDVRVLEEYVIKKISNKNS